MREFSGSTNVLTYLVTDHLPFAALRVLREASTSLTLDASGNVVSTTLRFPLSSPIRDN